MSGEKFTREQMIEAIHEHDGKITSVARALGCSRQTVYNYRDRYKTVAAALREAADDYDVQLLDLAERKLFDAVMQGEQWAVKYALEAKGSLRGYRRGVDLTTGGAPINITFDGIIDDDDDDAA